MNVNIQYFGDIFLFQMNKYIDHTGKIEAQCNYYQQINNSIDSVALVSNSQRAIHKYVHVLQNDNVDRANETIGKT